MQKAPLDKDARMTLRAQWEARLADEGLAPIGARVLKLLAGLNAALPKAAEAKPLSEMTDEEIKAAAGVK